MQKVLLLSSVTYECTHVTPSSAFLPTTPRHTPAPSAVTGMCSPPGNVLSTTYLGIFRSASAGRDFALRDRSSVAAARRRGIGGQPPIWASGPPIFA